MVPRKRASLPSLRSVVRRSPPYACVLLTLVLLGLGFATSPSRAALWAGFYLLVYGVSYAGLGWWFSRRPKDWVACATCTRSQPDGLIDALGFCFWCGVLARQAKPAGAEPA